MSQQPAAPLAPTSLEARLASLESHLRQENPILLAIVPSFRELDRVAQRMGLLGEDESFATQISWWPLIAVLGTYSAGKSSFVNEFLELDLQRTGSQAVDDRFTVICYGHDSQVRVLPGVALDADIRFPFFRISQEIDKVAAGEGRRIDAYLQLKTCKSEALAGKILIDSPGFDADAQRTSTLRITEHIIDLSDLVLVFFDARHPEPGAMRDTLEHLVAKAVDRPDTGKFLWILNQLDTVAREDNAEEVVAAWQRGIAEHGLHAGRFYTIYNRRCAVPIADPAVRARYEARRDTDLGEIRSRMREVEVSRSYRIVGALEKTARFLRDEATSVLTDGLARWRRMVVWTDGVLAALVVAASLWVSLRQGWWNGLSFEPAWLESLRSRPWLAIALAILAVVLVVFVHFRVRAFAARWVGNRLRHDGTQRERLERAFARCTRAWRPLWAAAPSGLGGGALRRIDKVLADATACVQALNDHYANPAGEARTAAPAVAQS